MADIKKIFGLNLSRLLEENHETQADLAEKMRVAPSSVSGWCTGTKMPRMDKVEWLAAHFNVSRSDLIEDQISSVESIPCPPSSEDLILLEKYRNLDGYGKEVVDLVLDAEHRRVSEQQDTVEFAARSGQRGKVKRVDNLDDLLPPADEDPSHI